MRKRNAVLGWMLVMLLICTLAVSVAQTRESEGRGFFMLGWRATDLDELNLALQGQEYAELSNNFLSIGGCGYGIKGKWILGGEGHAIENKDVASKGYKISLAGGYGLFNAGYLIHKKDNLNLYPMLGIGGGALTLNMVENSTPSFEEMLQYPKRGMQISTAGLMFSAGIGVDYLFAKKQSENEEGGMAIGLRIGYTIAPFVGGWIFRESEIAGGPELGITGPYVQVMIGGGGKKWQ